MRKYFWLLIIITTIIWLAIATYWTGTDDSKTPEQTDININLLPVTTPTPASPLRGTVDQEIATQSATVSGQPIEKALPSPEGTKFKY